MQGVGCGVGLSAYSTAPAARHQAIVCDTNLFCCWRGLILGFSFTPYRTGGRSDNGEKGYQHHRPSRLNAAAGILFRQCVIMPHACRC